MKVKNIFRAAVCLIAVSAVTTGCRFEEDDFFEESAALRIDHTNSAIQEILCSASTDSVDQEDAEKKYGWVIQYFVSGTDTKKYPGFNIFGKFYKDNHVVLSSDHAYIPSGGNKYTECTSTYDMLKEESCVLSFDTWNDIICVFEDPDYYPESDDDYGQCMGGDHSLIMMSYDENEMTFRGERHSARSHFVRLDRPAKQYLADTKTMQTRLGNDKVKTHYVVLGADTMYLKNLSTGRITYCDRLVDPLEQNTRSVVYTPNGFRTEYPDSVMGQLCQEFEVSADSSCLVSAGSDVKIIPMWDTYITSRSAVWNFDVETLTTEQMAIYDQLATNVTKFSSKYSLKGIGIGKKNNKTSLVLTFYTTTAKVDSKTNTGAYEIAVSRPAYGQQTIATVSNPTIDRNLQNIENKAPGTKDLMLQFIESILGTYNVVPNNYFEPTGGVFTSLDGQKTFTLE